MRDRERDVEKEGGPVCDALGTGHMCLCMETGISSAYLSKLLLRCPYRAHLVTHRHGSPMWHYATRLRWRLLRLPYRLRRWQRQRRRRCLVGTGRVCWHHTGSDYGVGSWAPATAAATTEGGVDRLFPRLIDTYIR